MSYFLPDDAHYFTGLLGTSTHIFRENIQSDFLMLFLVRKLLFGALYYININ